MREQNELKENEARARAFRQISVSNVLLETSKEVQMLYTHSSVTHSARFFSLRQKGHGTSRSLLSRAGSTRGIRFMRRCMQHVLPIGCPSVVDNSLLADSIGGEPTGAPYTALHSKFV